MEQPQTNARDVESPPAGQYLSLNKAKDDAAAGPLLRENIVEDFQEEDNRSPTARFAMNLWFVIAFLLYCFATLASVPMIIMSPMMFDSGLHPLTVFCFFLVVGLPVVCVVSMITMWQGMQRRNYRLALISSVMPLLYAVVVAIAFRIHG